MNAGKARGDRACALARLEQLWPELEYHHRCRFKGFCEFFMVSWTENCDGWTKAQKEQFLDSFEILLGERVDEVLGTCQLRGRGRHVEHDPKVDVPRARDLLNEEFTTAYCQRFRWSQT